MRGPRVRGRAARGASIGVGARGGDAVEGAVITGTATDRRRSAF